MYGAVAVGAAAIVVRGAMGSLLGCYHSSAAGCRQGATFVTDRQTIGLGVAITAHVGLGLADRDALRGMVRGWVPAAWARRRRPRWYEETVSATTTSASRPAPRA